MIVKKIATADINRAPYNPRRRLKPSDKEYQQIKNSLDTFGMVEPLVHNTSAVGTW